ncbi:MAG TPA: DinB family protein [Vicinamibacteria bacterium]|nr:DinB family protein [Vicinamibacteria bacterium]
MVRRESLEETRADRRQMDTARGETVAIAVELHRLLNGGGWHGPALFELLADVTPQEAAARPLPGAHGIWELLSHLTGWTEVALRRLDGIATEEPAAGDFPEAPAPTPSAWAAAQARMREATDRLIARLPRLGASDLDGPVIGRPHDTRYMLCGLVHHLAYHAGQIALLKKLAR